MMVDKDNLIKMVAIKICDELGLGSNCGNQIVNTMTIMFDDIVFESNKQCLSTQLCPNDVIIKNYIGCKKMQGIKDSSIKAYTTTINQFLTYNNINLTLVETNDIRRYLLYYQSSGVNLKTVDNTRRNLNTFFQFMEDEGYIMKNPCKKITHIKQEKVIQKFYNDLEMEEIRDNCETSREIALVDFLLSTGVRVSECANIKLSDIDWTGKTVMVDGKTGQRIVPFSIRAEKHLKEYLLTRKDKGDYLFAQCKGSCEKISKGGIQRIIKNIGQRAELPNITVHCFRRWFATDLCKKGVEPSVIQYLLGHKSFQTTMSYYIKNDIDKAKYYHSIYAC